MRVKLILPALTEATSPFFRPIKYSLFPPLGLATLAGYLRGDDEVSLQDEHVEVLDLDDEPDLVVIQVYITSAYRAYEIADHYRQKGAYVVLGGLHVTSLPDEAAQHADTICMGPGEDVWPAFLQDYRAGRPAPVYRSSTRTLEGLPRIRRDLIRRHLYLVPNSIVVSRGCPHSCDFCYKEAFFTECCIRTGICTTPVTSSIGRRVCLRKLSRRDTGGPTGNSTGGARSGAERQRRTPS
jgi:radical SAM superfamily enzyme YgiQ (UPF0313 family)